jgi:hypothetical protein
VDEVVRVGNLVVGDAEAVQPGVAGIAAHRAASGSACGSRDGKRRAHQSRPVSSRRRSRRRASPSCTSAGHASAAPRGSAQRDGGLAAELVRPLETYSSEPSWCGSSSSSPGASSARRRHPFTDPAVRPLTIHFWSAKKSSATGTAAISVPAVNGPPGLVVLVVDELVHPDRQRELVGRLEQRRGDHELVQREDERDQRDDAQHRSGER